MGMLDVAKDRWSFSRIKRKQDGKILEENMLQSAFQHTRTGIHLSAGQ
jgi:hypothetical protein